MKQQVEDSTESALCWRFLSFMMCKLCAILVSVLQIFPQTYVLSSMKFVYFAVYTEQHYQLVISIILFFFSVQLTPRHRIQDKKNFKWYEMLKN